MPEYIPPNAVIPRTSVAALVAIFEAETKRITDALSTLAQSQVNLKSAFVAKYSEFDVSNLVRDRHVRLTDANGIIECFRKEAWKVLVDRLDIRRIMAPQRVEMLNKALEKGELGPITDENILRVLDGFSSNLSDFMEEAIVDVFKKLTPQRSHYVTNSPAKNDYVIGRKVILSYSIGTCYGGRRESHWCVEWNGRKDVLRALDNVMSLLDGKGVIKSTEGDLVSAINSTPTTQPGGETSYFRFKCFRNQNLHLEFKRLDLLAELNRRGAAGMVRPNGGDE